MATGCPSPYGPSAVTFTGPAAEGNVSVTEATPELSVIAITLGPLLVPFESVPALVLNRMLAPVFVPPDEPGSSVTVSGFARAVPAAPDCPLPVCVNVAGGFPTTIHPPLVCVAVPSLPVTVKWQKPAVLPAVTVIVPGSAEVTVALFKVMVPPVHAAAPSKLSKTADCSVTFAAPLVISGCNVTVSPAATMVVSGFRSHSDTGGVATLPLITSNVALYGAKVIVDDHALEDEAVMVVGEF